LNVETATIRMNGGTDIYVIDSDGEFDLIEIVGGGEQCEQRTGVGSGDSARSDSRVTKRQANELIVIDSSEEETISLPAQKRRRVSDSSTSFRDSIDAHARAASSDDEVVIIEPPRQSENLSRSPQEHMARPNQDREIRQPAAVRQEILVYAEQPSPLPAADPSVMASSEQISQLRHAPTPSNQEKVDSNIVLHSANRISPMASVTSDSSLSGRTMDLTPDITLRNQCGEFGIEDDSDASTMHCGYKSSNVGFFRSIPARSSFGCSDELILLPVLAVTAQAVLRRKRKWCSDAAIPRTSTTEAGDDVVRSGSVDRGGTDSNDERSSFDTPPSTVFSNSGSTPAAHSLPRCHSSNGDLGTGARKRFRKFSTIMTKALLTELDSGCFRDLAATVLLCPFLMLSSIA
jgi:hypothetical protein